MKKFFARNLETRGRVVRGIAGVALLVMGVALCGVNVLAAVVSIVCGVFVLFEAVRGWCLMRACGIKTKL